MKLRPYQEELVSQLRNKIIEGKKRIVLCSPTGSGKSATFAFLVNSHVARGGSALILTHRSELFNQASSYFNDVEPINAGSNPDLSKSIHIAMIETIHRRVLDYKQFFRTKSLVIVDEAHLSTFDKIFPYITDDTIIIGATATPYRKGKKIPSLDSFYQDIAQGIDTPDLIKQGFLAPARTYGVEIDLSSAKSKGSDFDTSSIYEDNQIYKGVVDNYKKVAPNKKTILFASNIKSSKQVAEEFNLNGFKARHIDGNTPKNERKEILEWFDNTPDAILCNCGILTAGFDQPDIETVILYRATTSLPLFLQMCGRGSRLALNKTHFNILDFGNNIQRLGFWEDARTWTLNNNTSKSIKIGAAPVKLCKCGAIVAIQAKTCEYCGYKFPKKIKDEVFVELKELSKSKIMQQVKLWDVQKKVELAKAKVLHPYHILHNIKDINEARLFVKLMGYKHGFEQLNKQRFEVFRK